MRGHSLLILIAEARVRCLPKVGIGTKESNSCVIFRVMSGCVGRWRTCSLRLLLVLVIRLSSSLYWALYNILSRRTVYIIRKYRRRDSGIRNIYPSIPKNALITIGTQMQCNVCICQQLLKLKYNLVFTDSLINWIRACQESVRKQKMSGDVKAD